eukprot:TRINITY_DN21313_c0_g2_i1.p1 TRINITY_DN21313_c0_g2~~TRINITY_DN21313_c0_g2_i1.p1  ORF type:complete len:197 (+),score=47.69 TRINITY_DN21313_c0_g2_i1:52-591(+)
MPPKHSHGHGHGHDAVPTGGPCVVGSWTDGTVPCPSTITQKGTQITVTNPTQPWSPSVGTLHANGKIDFQSGGLTALVGAYNASLHEIHFTNGVKWSQPPTLPGSWQADQGSRNLTTIAMSGRNFTATNPSESWSPATGVLNTNNTINFKTGGLNALTATFDGTSRIFFSNNCSWTKVG